MALLTCLLNALDPGQAVIGHVFCGSVFPPLALQKGVLRSSSRIKVCSFAKSA